MRMSEQINELATALSDFQGEVVNPVKDKASKNYKYTDIASMLEYVRPLLKTHGLSVIQNVISSEDGKTTGVETMLLHKSGQWISNQAFTEQYIPISKSGYATMSPAQAAGSAITYLRRYALASVLGIAQTDTDADTQMSKREYVESITSGKPTDEQFDRLMELTPEESVKAATDWFNQSTQKAVEDYLLKQEKASETRKLQSA